MGFPELRRVEEAFVYLRRNVNHASGIKKLETWVYEDMTWTPIEIGHAICVEGPQFQQRENANRRCLMEAVLLVKLGAEGLHDLNVVDRWKRSIVSQPDDRLQSKLRPYLGRFLNRLKAPPKEDVLARKRLEPMELRGTRLVSNGKLTQQFVALLSKNLKKPYPQWCGQIHDRLRFTPTYRGGRVPRDGMTHSMLQTTATGKVLPQEPKGPLHRRVEEGLKLLTVDGFLPPKPADPVPARPSTFREKISFFESFTRPNVILSGHGTWTYDYANEEWPVTKLKMHQIIRFYCHRGHGFPTWVGQLVDSRAYPLPTEVVSGPRTIWDYTLNPQPNVKAGNNPIGDKHFVTVTKPTRLSVFLDRWPAATFHWCACRQYDVKHSDKSVDKKMARAKRALERNAIRWNPEYKCWEAHVRNWFNFGSDDQDDEIEISGWLEIPKGTFTESLDKSKGLHGKGSATYLY